YASQGGFQATNSLSLVGLATNIAPLPGFFAAPAGGTFAMPAPYAPGDTITFQIRAWTFSAGNTYEEAVISSNPMNVSMGFSAIGTTMLTGNPAPPAALFGTAPGLLNSGFYISAAPEPSTWALLGLGAVATALFSRRRNR